MDRKFFKVSIVVRALTRIGLAVVLLSLAANSMFAANCKVVHHPAPSEAETAFLAANFNRAAGLFQSELAKSPGDAALTVGLVHSLLKQQKLQEAASALPSSAGESPELMTIRGEVQLRLGQPQLAAASAIASMKLDPCNPRTMLLLSKLEGLSSQYAAERKMLMGAHRLDAEDPEIRLAWMKTLPAAARIQETEAYLAAPEGDTEKDHKELQTNLDRLKAWAAEPRKPCTMVSTAKATEIPFVSILDYQDRLAAYGLSVKINNRAARIVIDTSYNARLGIDGGSGLLISKAVAQRAGLKAVIHNDVAGTGPQKARDGYIAFADSIAIGGVEFHDCAVQVMEVNFPNSADGIISMDILSSYLVTIDFPGKKLVLDPLPPRPETAAAVDGLYDRYRAPEMKDYTPFYRSGSDLILPVSVNGNQPMLFVADTAIGPSAFAPQTAYELLNGHRDPRLEVRDANGKLPSGTVSIDHAAFSYAGVPWEEDRLISFDVSAFSDDSGMDISGLVGIRSLSRMTLHIDYRDGLMKIELDPKHKSPIM
jgi:Aspartyl protease